MFSQGYVKNSVHGACMAGGAYMAVGPHAWQGGMCGRGGGVHGRGPCVVRGVCVARGGAVDGTHPTGMHCFHLII